MIKFIYAISGTRFMIDRSAGETEYTHDRKEAAKRNYRPKIVIGTIIDNHTYNVIVAITDT